MINKNSFSIYRNNPNLIYLDYAATTFMPDIVIDAWNEFQSNIGVTISRGNSFLSIKAQEIFHTSKEIIKDFFDASEDYEIIFTKNSTESLNLLANTISEKLNSGDYILISPFEHHSNILPWKNIAEKVGASVVMLPPLENNDLDYNFINNLPKNKIKVISVSMISNINSSKVNLNKISKIAKESNAYLIYDVSQAVGHIKLDFSSINADAYVMSAHKMYGPKNVGACILKKRFLEILPPFLLGGGMVWNTLGGNPEWHQGTLKYLAGTFDIGLIYAWSKACEFLKMLNIEQIEKFENDFGEYVKSNLKTIPELQIVKFGEKSINTICSFSINKIHPHDLEEILSKEKIIIRTGHMCSQNTLNILGKESLCRISWGIGSKKSDIDKLIEIIKKGI